jgi:hypothetical protein
MAIEFSCSCGQKFRVADEHAGRKTKCKGCGNVIAIPVRAKPQPARQAAGQSASKSGGVPSKKSAPKPDDDLFILEPSETDDASDDESEFEFAIEETTPKRRLPGKPGAKKKRKPVESADDRNAKSKGKKSKKSSEGISKPMIALFAVFGLIGLTGVGFAVVKMVAGAGGPAKPVEKQWGTFHHELGNFKIEHPTDWKVSSKGGTGGILPWALFEGDDASVRVRADQNGSSIGTIAQAGSNLGFSVPGVDQEEAPDELDPVAAVHEFQVNDVKGDYNDYEETPPETITTPFGEGRLSVFTASSGFSKYKGLRCTFLASDFQYNIICKISSGQFDKFEPVFRRMVMSFQR